MTVTEPSAPPWRRRPPPRSSPPKQRYADELAFLAAYDDGPAPARLAAHPARGGHLHRAAARRGAAAARGRARRRTTAGQLTIAPKFVGDRALVERCVVTLAGERGLLLVGEPGTAKSMLSELLAAAICGTSALTVQGTAGTTEDALPLRLELRPAARPGPEPRRRWSPRRC